MVKNGGNDSSLDLNLNGLSTKREIESNIPPEFIVRVPGAPGNFPCKDLISYSSFFDAVRSDYDAVAKICKDCGWWHLREVRGERFLVKEKEENG